VNTHSLERFRGLFADESVTRLERIQQLLLGIDQPDSAADALDQIFREVHTIKGAAAVVGFERVSAYAHRLEARLEELRAGRRALTTADVDALLASADELGRLTELALSGNGEHHELPASEAGVREVGPTVQPATRSADGPADRMAAPSTGSSAAGRAAIQVPVDRLDDLVRLVGEAAVANLRVERMVRQRLGADTAEAGEMLALSRLLNDLQDRAMRTRMVPLTTITDQLRRAVRDVARALGNEVRWEVAGADTELDRTVLHELSDSLLHLVRNAVDHGIESPPDRIAAGKPSWGTVRLSASQAGSEVTIAVSDDGRGIDVAGVRANATRHGLSVDDLSDRDSLELVFRSGVSTAAALSDISGRGVGLDVVRASVDAARGRIEIDSEPGAGTSIRLTVPISLSLRSCVLVETSGQRFALPIDRVEVVHDQSVRIIRAEGRRMVWVNDAPVTVTALSDVLGLEPANEAGPIVVVKGSHHSHAFVVDAVAAQRDVVIKGVSALLPRLDLVAGASVDPDGSVLVVLDPSGLVDRARSSVTHTAPVERVDRGDRAGPSAAILVVDDAVTVRELQRSILERAGYHVSVASDGVQALARLSSGDVDLVLTDVQMPNMDGFALTRAIRGNPTLANLPVVILSSLSSEHDRREGLDAGADAYVVKSSFDEAALLDVVARSLGRTT
jgi:two-component system chemotaxis sensor kinase CheA